MLDQEYGTTFTFKFSFSVILFVFFSADSIVYMLWTKEEVMKRMATEFQGDITQESILQSLDGGMELAGDEQALASPGIAVICFIVELS